MRSTAGNGCHGHHTLVLWPLKQQKNIYFKLWKKKKNPEENATGQPCRLTLSRSPLGTAEADRLTAVLPPRMPAHRIAAPSPRGPASSPQPPPGARGAARAQYPACSGRAARTKMAAPLDEYEKEAGCVPILHPEVRPGPPGAAAGRGLGAWRARRSALRVGEADGLSGARELRRRPPLPAWVCAVGRDGAGRAEEGADAAVRVAESGVRRGPCAEPGRGGGARPGRPRPSASEPPLPGSAAPRSPPGPAAPRETLRGRNRRFLRLRGTARGRPAPIQPTVRGFI